MEFDLHLASALVACFRITEVDDTWEACLRENDIAICEVSMDHAGLMNVDQRQNQTHSGGTCGEFVDKFNIIDIKQFREVDAIWAEWVGPPYPVSTCVQVS